MKLTENEINTGIIIKAIFENVQKGKMTYTIHPVWQKIIDHNRLNSYQSIGFLEYSENVLTLTSKGLDELKSLFNTNEAVPINELMQKKSSCILINLAKLIKRKINVNMKKGVFKHMRRLLYDDMRVLVATRTAEDKAKQLGCTYNREYLDHHNHICPGCHKEMKIERHSNTVKQIGAIGIGFYEKLKLIYPYVVCKPCSKEVKGRKAEVDKTENYLLETLGLIEVSGN